MTKFRDDILREPNELLNGLSYTLGEGRAALDEAVNILRDAPALYLIGIGSSWSAGLAMMPFFNAASLPVVLCDASELLHFGEIKKDSVAIVLSRSGESTEIVKLLPKLATRNATIIAITNTPESSLARQAHVVLKMMAAFDHAVSVSMYSVMALIGGLLVCSISGNLHENLATRLKAAISEADEKLGSWQAQIESGDWLQPDRGVYLLARGSSLGSANESRLLWEEAAKLPACAMSTGNFRHGPQEVIREGMRFMVWIDGAKMRSEDLALAKDLRKLGAKVLAIGQNLPSEVGDLVLQIPSILAEWQFVLDIIPSQIAAECLARRGKQDCDNFRLCQFIVADEGGLIGPDTKL